MQSLTIATKLLSPLLQLLLLLQLLQLAAAAAAAVTTTAEASAAAATAAAADNQKCHCTPVNCLCCVQLNLTKSIDLGGPACANVRQREKNVTLNLTYADNDTHNATIALDGAARKPTCMNLLSDLAQICAKFSSMVANSRKGENVYTGCLVIEPALLGTSQATYPVGCFEFDRGQVRQVQSVPEFQGQKDEEDEEEDDQSINAEELLAVVSASAEQGIAFFTRWLGLSLQGSRPNSTVGTGNAAAAAAADGNKRDRQLLPANSASRSGRTISILLENTEDKSDEKLKQLLSAQDNIVKESATIGDKSSGQGTVFFYPQTETKSVPNNNNVDSVATISPENLAIVSSESRRGGRAYNIHQHVNEV